MANVATELGGGSATEKKSGWSWLNKALDTVSSTLKSVSSSMGDVKDIAQGYADTKSILGGTPSASSSVVSSNDSFLPVALVVGVLGLAKFLF